MKKSLLVAKYIYLYVCSPSILNKVRFFVVVVFAPFQNHANRLVLLLLLI